MMRQSPSPKGKDKLKDALSKGKISHADLEGIIKRFQTYEEQSINQSLGKLSSFNVSILFVYAGLPPDTQE